MEVITEKETLSGITFPSKCLRCFVDFASHQVQIIETNFFIRSLHNPFSIISISIFLISGISVAVLSYFLEKDLLWIWLFVTVLIVSVLRNLSEKSSRIIELSYCQSCLKKWERAINIEYGLKTIFVVGSSITFLMGFHKAFPSVLLSVWAILFVFFFFVKKFLKQSDPPLDFRRFNQDAVTLNFGNNDFAKQTIEMNNQLKAGFKCSDCGTFISLKDRKCLKCEARVEGSQNG